MKNFFFILFISFVSIAFGEDKEEVCIDPAMDPSKNVAQALGIDPSKITVPHLKYKGFLTPEELRKYDANTIAELFMKRINEGCDKIRGGDESTTVGEHSEIMMFTNMELWDSIAKTGFQNQHVTATTKGADTREGRYSAESTLLGSIIGYSSKAKDILPKYSGLNVLAKNHFNSPGHAVSAEYYGNSAVVFNDNVKKRTSFTPWDSLGAAKFRGSPIVSTLDFRDVTESKKQYRCSIGYCEAQIWGKVGLEDVKYALIPVGSEVPKSFIERGIPVYYVQSGKNGTLAWEKGKIAFDPKKPENLSKIKSPESLEKPSSDCDNCNPVEKRVSEHHQFANWEYDRLVARYEKEENPDQKREILGEIALRKDEKKQDFLSKVYANNLPVTSMYSMTPKADPIVTATVLQGLVDNPKDPKLKELVVDSLTKAIAENKESAARMKKMIEDTMAIYLKTTKLYEEAAKAHSHPIPGLASAGAVGLVGSGSLGSTTSLKSGYYPVAAGAYGGGLLAGAGSGAIEMGAGGSAFEPAEGWEGYNHKLPTSPDVLMAIALASELKDLKDDPKIQQLVLEIVSSFDSEYLKTFYNYLNGDDKATMCDPLPKDFDAEIAKKLAK